jgi:hypothetical protein
MIGRSSSEHWLDGINAMGMAPRVVRFTWLVVLLAIVASVIDDAGEDL